MLKPLTLALAVAFTASLSADTDCDVNMREGNLNKLTMPESAECKIKEPGKEAEKKTASAKDGHQYAVLTIKLAAGKSIGLYDYSLQEEGGSTKFNVVGMSISDGPYQRKTWEVRASGDTKVSWVGIHSDASTKPFRQGSEDIDADTEIKLLFEVPSGSKRFKLVSRLLDKALAKEYGVSEVLDFDKMSTVAATPVKEVKEEKEDSVDEAPKEEKEDSEDGDPFK
jgi:hypothetical protein